MPRSSPLLASLKNHKGVCANPTFREPPFLIFASTESGGIPLSSNCASASCGGATTRATPAPTTAAPASNDLLLRSEASSLSLMSFVIAHAPGSGSADTCSSLSCSTSREMSFRTCECPGDLQKRLSSELGLRCLSCRGSQSTCATLEISILSASASSAGSRRLDPKNTDQCDQRRFRPPPKHQLML